MEDTHQNEPVLALERRLTNVEARNDVTELLHRYSHAIDYGDEAAWTACFTPDAIFVSDNKVTGLRRTIGDGQAELAQWISGHTWAPELFHKHVVVDPVIEVHDGEARCTSYFTVLMAGPGRLPTIVSFGRYVDQLRRDTEGRWRIFHRIAEIEASSPAWTELRDIRRRALNIAEVV